MIDPEEKQQAEGALPDIIEENSHWLFNSHRSLLPP